MTGELERPDYRANPTNRCYFCKHELYTHLTRIAARRSAVGDRRRTMRTTAATIARAVRPRASSACAVRSTRLDLGKAEIRELPAVPACRLLGRARLGVSVLAHSVSQRGHRRKTSPDRACRAGGSNPRLPSCAACGTTTISPVSSSAATNCRVRWIRRRPPPSSARSRRSAIGTSRSIRVDIAPEASTKAAPAAGVTPSPRSDRRTVRRRVCRVPPPVSSRLPRRSRFNQLRPPARVISTSPGISRIRPVTRCMFWRQRACTRSASADGPLAQPV